MAQSLIGGLVANGTRGGDIIVADPHEETVKTAANKWNITIAGDNRDAAARANVIVLAVKPQQMKAVLTDMAGELSQQLLVSIAAGILTRDIQRWAEAAQKDIAVVRCMPNTPALIQCGATGLFAEPGVTTDQRNTAENILKAAGTTAWVEKESQLDAITALSGSGPAYFFLMIEAMTDAAIELGLNHDLALHFATRTALGAARMIDEGNVDPAQLRKNVTSPAGTTEAALNSFNNDNFKKVVLTAMRAADKRAQQLGSELGR